jgi:hypothetical protein
LKNIFQILPEENIPAEANLFIEVSDEGLNFFFEKHEPKMITGLSVFKFQQKSNNADVANMIERVFSEQEYLKGSFRNVFISYAFNESILTPAPYYNQNLNTENLNLLYGDMQGGVVLADYIIEKDIYNLYRIPANVYNIITRHFPDAVTIHQYTLFIKQLQPESTTLKVIVYQDKIIIILQKAGNLQIIQAFTYVTAADILYHMLNVCKQFNANEANVQLCGMIEQNSALFKEIKKYFLHVAFCELPGELIYADKIKQFPGHFFSHLFAFALCV